MKSFVVASIVVFTVGCEHRNIPTSNPSPASDMTMQAPSDMAFSSGTDDVGTGAPTSLTITPSPAMATATVVNGVVTTTPVTFTAVDQNGYVVTAAWQIDRGELGTLSSAGVFTANGINGGVANVTATAGVVQATAQLTVTVTATNLGAQPTSGTGAQTPNDAGAPPLGGYNGVGGQPLGSAPPTATVTALQNGSGSNAAFTMLYPYDQTVFPRGMLPPLLQWTVPASYNATAVEVHLKESGYEFYGFYSGSNLVNAPIDAAAWSTATADNAGDPLLVEVKITDGNTVLGPLSLHFIVAPSRLRGTIYYNTYDSKLPGLGTANGSDGNGAVLRIDPGSSSPVIAVPSNTNGQCYACHEVSADGSTLFAANSIDDGTNSGFVYDLKGGMQKKAYSKQTTPASGGLFTYGGIYPDGSMALVSSNEDYHAASVSSDVYSPSTLASVGTTGFTSIVKQAVTPSFSPDGRHAAFAFWAAQANITPPIPATQQTLAVADFSCGAATSSVTCASNGPFAFSGLRLLYQDSNTSHYVGWPSFTPDGAMVVFQHSFVGSSDGGSVLNTRNGAQAELWLADVPDATSGMTRFSPMGLCALNGYQSDCATPSIPTTQGTNHAHDTQMNFEPNVTPIAAGGYYWVVFTSRRLYGNVATTDPYVPRQNDPPATSPPCKKLWMAAIDPNPKPGVDPSHPAFYLPGQEIMAGNMRAFWVNEPCEANGLSCQTGDQCCSGYCTDDGSGSLTCGNKPVGCIPEYGKCTTDADCCGSGSLTCIDGLCSVSPIL
jgi:hypothetical protein